MKNVYLRLEEVSPSYCEQTLIEAKRAFLRRQFVKAYHITKKFLASGTNIQFRHEIELVDIQSFIHLKFDLEYPSSSGEQNEAAAILIQSCYELSCIPAAVLTYKRIPNLLDLINQTLSIIFRTFTSESRCMSFDLAVLLIQFCEKLSQHDNLDATFRSLLHSIVVLLGTKLFASLLARDKQAYTGEKLLYDARYQYCIRELLSLVYVKTLPYIRDSKLVYQVIFELNQEELNPEKNYQSAFIHKVPLTSWIKDNMVHTRNVILIVDFLRARNNSENTSGFISDICEEIAQELGAFLKIQNTEFLKSQNRNTERLFDVDESYIKTFTSEYIVQPLWLSDSRWENRIKVATFVLGTVASVYTLSQRRQKRKSPLNKALSKESWMTLAGSMLIKPLKELVEAALPG